MKESDFVAIQKPGDDYLTWYDRSDFGPPPKFSDEESSRVQSISYSPSGKIVTRENGNGVDVAEIWEQVPMNRKT